jgi:endo-1,3(4)-beta-glucanase
MSKMVLILLICARLSLVYSIPVVEVNHGLAGLEEREIAAIPSVLQTTTSYSTAIKSLQSVTISILPSITGVCTTLYVEMSTGTD